MTHVLKQLSDAVVAALSGVSEIGSDWSQRRFWPAERDTAADGIVYADGEDVSTLSTAPLTYDRDVEVTVAMRFTGEASGLEGRAWTAQALVETALETDATLAGTVNAMFLRRSETQTDGSAAKAQLTRILTYRASLYSAAADPETIL